MLSGLVERVVFHNPDSGFCVLRIKLADRNEPVTVVGRAATVQPGEVVRAEGVWQADPVWGPQFRAAELTVLPPTTLEGIEAYLGSGMIRGIGRGIAHKLVEAFGERVFEVIERQPERLREIPGIGRGLAERIAAAWEEQRAVRDIMLFLHAHGLSPLRAARIFETYGARAIEVVGADPFRLARDVRGIGFQAADELAGRLGFPADSPKRVRAGIDFVLGENLARGHSGMPRALLIEEAALRLKVAEALVEGALAESVRVGEVVEVGLDGTLCLFPAVIDAAEREIAGRLRTLAEGRPAWAETDPEPTIAAVEEELGLVLAGEQREAVRLALRSKVLVVTGGPGTGKTTLVNAILAALPRGEGAIEVALAAPTGRAARRLGESTGREARTLHRLLEAEPGRGFRRGPLRPLACDLLVVDEVSMVDVPLMQGTLAALPEAAALLLVGDVDQLPSIGPGQVLADVIACGRFPVVRLTQIFRQAAASRIVVNAHRINRGQMPDLERPAEGLTDFYAIRCHDPDDGAAKVLQLVTERIPESFGLDPVADVQVLCPTNRGRLGARTLNAELQALLNPDPPERIERHGLAFALGDKVMQTENDYEREVYNGDLGRVTAIDQEARTLVAEIDGRPVFYGFDELDRLVPAYAITVHKAQGSEYPAVVLPLVMAQGRMLRRNLVYTAITRARRLAVVVTEAGALELAVTGRPEPRRWSRLRDLLRA